MRSAARCLAWSRTVGSSWYLALESGTGWVASRTAWTMAATSRISSAPMPRAGAAGVPRRRPLVDPPPWGAKGGTGARAGGVRAAVGVEGDHVAVEGDAGLAQGGLGLAAGEAVGAGVDQQQVVVGAAGDHGRPLLLEGVGQGGGVVDDPLGVVGELRPGGLGQGDRLGGQDRAQGPPAAGRAPP